MRTFKRLKAFTALIIFTFVQQSWAAGDGPSNGGGGGGVISGANVYVVDLVEAGVESNPFFDQSIAPNAEFSKRIADALHNVPNVPVALISQKLNEIYSLYDHKIPQEVILMLEMYSWQMLDFSLVQISDENPVVNIPLRRQVQLAARIRQAVKLDRKLWAKLNPANKAALILHEAIYALSETQNSDDARSIVGYLFSPDLKANGLNGFRNAFNSDRSLLGGVEDGILVCHPGNQLVDCLNGEVGIATLTSNRQQVALSTSINFRDLKDAHLSHMGFANNMYDTRGTEELPNALGYLIAVDSQFESASKKYCGLLMSTLRNSDLTVYGETSSAYDGGLIRESIKSIVSIKAKSGYVESFKPLTFDSTGAFLLANVPSSILVIQASHSIEWASAKLSEADCERAEQQTAREAVVAIRGLYK